MVLQVECKHETRGVVTVPGHLISKILSFLDASDFLSAVRASQTVFSDPLQELLGGTTSLSLSFLLRVYPNTLQGNEQQQIAIQILMRHLFSSDTTAKPLHRLELANLRGATGVGWLPQLTSIPLITLDLSNNVRVDAALLKNYLHECPTTLRHLHLTGCSQVTPDVLEPLTEERHSQLRSLSIGGCSQTIETGFIISLLQNLRKLEHLNLQSMNHVDDAAIVGDSPATIADSLPNTLKSINLTGTKPLQLLSREGNDLLAFYRRKQEEYGRLQRRHISELREAIARKTRGEFGGPEPVAIPTEMNFVMDDAPHYRIQLENLVLDGTGLGRLSFGTLYIYSLGRSLREVHLAGCGSMIREWEIKSLAYACGHSLVCLQMQGTSIGLRAVKSVAKYCRVLAEIDFSACQNIEDEAVVALCDTRCGFVEDGKGSGSGTNMSRASKRRRIETYLPLKVLRLASNPKLTDASVRAISVLKALHVLDIHDCCEISPSVVHCTAQSLPELIDLNAKDIGWGKESKSITQLLRKDLSVTRSLKFVNGRTFSFSSASKKPSEGQSPSQEECRMNCCIVRSQSQRLTPSVPLQSMYHCVDCHLIPSLDRGICATCREKCHKGHNTFLGSYTRFYCDCPFGVEASNVCQAIFPASRVAADVGEDTKPAAVATVN